MRLAKFHDYTMPRTDLGTDSDIKPVGKFAKSLTKTSNKVHELRTYDEAIDNPIHRNRWYKAINEKL